MNVLDYIVLALAVGFVVIGIFKGLMRQILTIIGLIVVASLTATVSPYVQGWLANTTMSENTRLIVAMLVSIVILAVAYSIVAWLILKLLKRIKIVKALDGILGAVLGLAIVYLFFGVIFALFNSTSEEFLPLLKSWAGDYFRDSWIAQNIYGKNPFGDWIVVDIAEKLLESITPAV